MDEEGVRALMRERIKDSGLTQTQFAMLKELSPGYLSEFLTGRCGAGPRILDVLGLEVVPLSTKFTFKA